MGEERQKQVNEMPRNRRIAWFVVLLICLTLLSFVAFSAIYMMAFWSTVSLAELFTQLKALQGVGGSSLANFLMFTCLPTLALDAIFVVCYFSFAKKKSPKGIRWTLRMAGIFTLLFPISSLTVTWNYMGVTEYLALAQENSVLLDENYVDPYSVRITRPEEKKNIILLFLESMETTWSGSKYGGASAENLIPELTEISLSKGEDFGDHVALNGSIPLEFSSWTAASLFTNTSGVPLKIPLTSPAISEKWTYFPGVTSLGDILEVDGYNQVYLCGSDAAFGGRKTYFSAHGDYSFYDLCYYESLPEEDPRHVENDGFWGFNDQRLFGYAKEIIQGLSEDYLSSGTPFNFTTLTVDTHFPSGNPCPLCKEEFDNAYANVYACSSAQASEFISWFYDSGEVDPLTSSNTVMLVLGDHLTMTNKPPVEIQGEYARKTFVSYFNSFATPIHDVPRRYSPLDTFPTLLSAMGYQIEGDRLGLGVNLYGDIPTLTEEIGEEELNEEVQKTSKVLESLLTYDCSDMDELLRTNRYPKVRSTSSTLNEDGSLTCRLSHISNDYEKMEPYVRITYPNNEEVTYRLYQESEEDFEATFLINEETYNLSFFLLGECGNIYSV